MAIGYDNVGTFVEKLAVKPTGAIAVSGDAGAAGQVLQSNGAGAAASWASPTAGGFNNTFMAVGTDPVLLTSSSGLVPLPGLAQTFTVTDDARVLLNMAVGVFPPPCVLCGETSVNVWVYLDGVGQRYRGETVTNGTVHTVSNTLVLNVTAGTHTVEIRAQNAGGPDLYVSWSGQESGTLTLLVMQR